MNTENIQLAIGDEDLTDILQELACEEPDCDTIKKAESIACQLEKEVTSLLRKADISVFHGKYCIEKAILLQQKYQEKGQHFKELANLYATIEQELKGTSFIPIEAVSLFEETKNPIKSITFIDSSDRNRLECINGFIVYLKNQRKDVSPKDCLAHFKKYIELLGDYENTVRQMRTIHSKMMHLLNNMAFQGRLWNYCYEIAALYWDETLYAGCRHPQCLQERIMLCWSIKDNLRGEEDEWEEDSICLDEKLLLISDFSSPTYTVVSKKIERLEKLLQDDNGSREEKISLHSDVLFALNETAKDNFEYDYLSSSIKNLLDSTFLSKSQKKAITEQQQKLHLRIGVDKKNLIQRSLNLYNSLSVLHDFSIKMDFLIDVIEFLLKADTFTTVQREKYKNKIKLLRYRLWSDKIGQKGFINELHKVVESLKAKTGEIKSATKGTLVIQNRIDDIVEDEKKETVICTGNGKNTHKPQTALLVAQQTGTEPVNLKTPAERAMLAQSKSDFKEEKQGMSIDTENGKNTSKLQVPILPQQQVKAEEEPKTVESTKKKGSSKSRSAKGKAAISSVTITEAGGIIYEGVVPLPIFATVKKKVEEYNKTAYKWSYDRISLTDIRRKIRIRFTPKKDSGVWARIKTNYRNGYLGEAAKEIIRLCGTE